MQTFKEFTYAAVATPPYIVEKDYFHGTSAADFTEFRDGLIYLAPAPEEALAFAVNPILGGGRGKGQPRVMKVQAKPGKSKNIDDAVMDALMNDDDIDEVIEQEATKARQEGFRYMTFHHPSSVDGSDEFEATISLYPKQDLKITQTVKV